MKRHASFIVRIFFNKNYFDMNGWVKLHRKMLEWEWYDKSHTVHLFIHCLLKANHEETTWKDIYIEKGSFFTSVAKLSVELNMTTQTVRTSLKHLQLTNDITIKTVTQGSVIQVINYDKYQEVTNNVASALTSKLTRYNIRNKEEDTCARRSFDHLSISEKDYQKLCDKYGQEETDLTLDAIENYKGNKNYKNLYLTANNWLRRDQKKNAPDKEDKLLEQAKKMGYVK